MLPSTKRIVRRDGGGFYAVLSADGDLQDGIEPSLAIRDEVHRWKTLRAETLHDVITKGQISREEPLDIGITTAGAEYESPAVVARIPACQEGAGWLAPLRYVLCGHLGSRRQADRERTGVLEVARGTRGGEPQSHED